MANELRIGGVAAVFDSPAEIRTPVGSFVEVIKPGAFTRTLRDRADDGDVFLLAQHSYGNPLARVKNGSLVLREDASGLRFEATLPDTSSGRDIHELVRTGVVAGMSFGFNVDDDRWSESNGVPVREIIGVTLREISVVTLAAYKTTTVATRRKVTPAVQRRLTQLAAVRTSVANAK